MLITLPWPDKRLFPNFKRANHWRKYRNAERDARALGWDLACEALPPHVRQQIAHGDGPIRMTVTFYPPDNRGDRVNFPNRCKPIFDGIADAMKVNDKRFVPSFEFCEPKAPGRVEVFISSSAHTGFEAMKGGQVDADTSEPCPGTVAYKESDHD